MRLKATTIIIFLVSIIAYNTMAQPWKIKNYSAGYRVFELNSFGNNPTTIARLLKNPVPYIRYLNTITSNSIKGNPGIVQLHTFYVNAEWNRNNPLLRFWKKYTLQTGLLITGSIAEEAGAIGEESYLISTDTVVYRNMFAISKKQQFFGVTTGVNRRFSLSRKLKFLTGLHVQGSFALVHHYKQRWDSSTFTPRTGLINKVTNLPNLKGTNFFQWQAMVPLGLEYALHNERFFVKLELSAGIVGNRYISKSFATREAHGAGVWLIYKPKADR